MENPTDSKTLLAAYHVPGFRAQSRVDSHEHVPPAFVITQVRRQKKRFAVAAESLTPASTTSDGVAPAIWVVVTARFISTLRCVA